VVPDLGCVVEDPTFGGADDLLQALAFEVGAGYEVVEVGDVGLVVLSMVIVEGLSRDVRREGLAVVRKLGQCERHGVLLLRLVCVSLHEGCCRGKRSLTVGA